MSNQVNPLSLSDDDFDIDSLLAQRDASEAADEAYDEEEHDDSTEEEEDDVDASTDSDDEETDESEEDSEDSEESSEGEEDSDTEDETEDEAESTEELSDEKATKNDADESNQASAEDQLAKLFAPFRANNKEMKIDSVEDAIQLMQMGANYSSKMVALKPNLKVLRTLEKHNLLDEAKINYLIDLDKKDPAAIAKLIADSGIDPLDVNTEESSTYSPKSYAVTNSEVAIAEVLDEIRDSPSFPDTIKIVGNKWDDASRDLIAGNPGVLRLINDHVADGTYEQVMNMVQRERMMGRLTDVPDVVAYDQVGTAMREKGLLQARGQTPPAQKPTAPQAPKKVVVPTENKTKQAKRAAASPKKATPEPKMTFDESINPLSLSDEEFEKLMANKYR